MMRGPVATLTTTLDPAAVPTAMPAPARRAELVLRLAVALMCFGLCKRWLADDSPIFGLLYFDHGLLDERTAQGVDDAGFVLLAIAGLLVLTRLARTGLAYAGSFALALAVCSAVRDPHGPWLVIASQAVRFVAPLALFAWLSRDGRTRRDLDGVVVFALRLAAAATFTGHGLDALRLEPRFLDLLFAAYRETTAAELPQATAELLLRAIGALDLVVAAMIVALRWRSIAAWMAFWGLLTATSRMVHSGWGNWAETLLRAPNGMVPLALVFAFALPRLTPPPVQRVDEGESS